MPVYKYIALNNKGKEVKETLEANSIAHLKQILEKKQLIPIQIEEITPKPKKNFLSLSFGKKSKISNDELVFILYEIGLLLDKNVHITSVLDILSKQQENEELKNNLIKVKSLIAEGNTIAQAFEQVDIFPKFLIEMIRAGEESGSLGKIFLSASEFIQQQNEFKSKIINSLIYPSIVIGVGFIALIIIMNVVVPTVVKIYHQFGREIPASTKAVIFISNIFSIVLKSIPLLVIIVLIAKKKYIKKHHIDKIKSKIPFFNKVLFYSEISSWANTLYILLKGGLTLTKSLEIANSTINNSILKNKLNQTIGEIEKGKRFSDSLQEKKILPESSIQIIILGEETGQLEDMFNMIANIYKKQTEKLITRFITLLEPITLIILSVLIGFFIFATLFPIFNLSVKG